MTSRTVLLGLGVAGFSALLGWGLALREPRPIRAASSSTVSEGSVMLSGPVALQGEGLSTTKTKVQDAVYYLDYQGARLLATVPQMQQTVQGTQVIGRFAVRDLIRDFRIPNGTTPRFLMSVAEIADPTGWAPLIVLETETGRVATYRAYPTAIGPSGSEAPRFELIELRELP